MIGNIVGFIDCKWILHIDCLKDMEHVLSYHVYLLDIKHALSCILLLISNVSQARIQANEYLYTKQKGEKKILTKTK